MPSDKPHTQKKRKQRTYSDKQISRVLATLDANGGKLLLTSRQTGVAQSTIREWRDGRSRRAKTPDAIEGRQEAREDLADIFERVARLYLKQAGRGKVAVKATGQQAVIAAATATDKMRLLRDQGPPPTEAAKTAAEAMKQAASALVALSKRTASPLDLAAAESHIRELQLQNATLASEATQ